MSPAVKIAVVATLVLFAALHLKGGAALDGAATGAGAQVVKLSGD